MKAGRQQGGLLSKRCLSGQRVPLWLDFFGSFCVKTKRTQEWAMKGKLDMIKGGNVDYEKTLWFQAKKLSRFGTRKFPRLRSGWPNNIIENAIALSLKTQNCFKPTRSFAHAQDDRMCKTLSLLAKKLSKFGTRKFPRQARDDEIEYEKTLLLSAWKAITALSR